MAPAEGEVSVHPAIGASRAEAQRPVVQEVLVVAVRHAAVAEVPVAAVVDGVAVDAGDQEIENDDKD